MSHALYRKYRSQTFDELIGQSHITKILKNAVAKDALSHAYLFVGSRGTGKTSAARILAKAANCTDISKDGNPCNQCNACKSIANGTFLDLIEIDAASNRGVDQIRELKEKIEYSPVEGKYKVYIIDEVHMLTNEAFNALLKTLEEPPAHVIFILATTDVHKLPATILSRCQRYDFRLGTDEEVRQLLTTTAEIEGVKLSKEALNILVENAHGSYRDGLSLLDVVVGGQLESDKPNEVSENEVRRVLGIPDTTMVVYLLEKLIHKELQDVLKLISELENKGVNLQQFVKYILVSLRQMLIGKVAGTVDYSLYPFAKDITERELLTFINVFLEAERSLKSTYLPALVLEMLSVQLCLGIEKSDSKPTTKKPADNSSAKSVSTPSENKKVVDETVVDEAESKASDVKVKDQVDEIKEEKKVEKVIKSDKPEAGLYAGIPDGITIKEIREKWDKFVGTLQQFNAHLYAFVKSADLVEVINGKELVIGVPFEFHKERIESFTSKEIINNAFKEVYDFMMPFRCKVDATIKRKKKVSADIVLKNVVNSDSAKPASNTAPAEPAKSGEDGKVIFKPGAQGPFPHKVSKQVAAIFEGM